MRLMELQMEFANDVGTFLVGVLIFVFCAFLFVGIMSAMFMFLGFVLELLILPCTLISLLVEFLLVRNTKLDGIGLKSTQTALVTVSAAGITAGIAALCGAQLPSILIFACVGAFYGLVSSLTTGLGRRFHEKPRQ